VARNVRELQNVIEHAVVMLEPGAEVRPRTSLLESGRPIRKAADEAPRRDASY